MRILSATLVILGFGKTLEAQSVESLAVKEAETCATFIIEAAIKKVQKEERHLTESEVSRLDTLCRKKYDPRIKDCMRELSPHEVSTIADMLNDRIKAIGGPQSLVTNPSLSQVIRHLKPMVFQVVQHTVLCKNEDDAGRNQDGFLKNPLWLVGIGLIVFLTWLLRRSRP